MERIRRCGGLPVLAHATQLRKENFAQLENEIKNLVDQGLAGVEVIHSDFDEITVKFLNDLADKFHLAKTGGSDFHGTNKTNIELGVANGRRIPRKFFDQLVDHLTKKKKAG
jgi:hypothetical protein